MNTPRIVQQHWQALVVAEQLGAPLTGLERMYDRYLLLTDATQRDREGTESTTKQVTQVTQALDSTLQQGGSPHVSL